MSAQAMIEYSAMMAGDDAEADSTVVSDAVLDWHLTCNHFPPILDAVTFARMAIEAVEEGRGNEPLGTGPDATVPRRAPSAWHVVESWHLEDFVQVQDD